MERFYEKIKVIGSTVFSEAEKSSQQLIQKANLTREKELKSFEDLLVNKAGECIQAETRAIRLEAVRSVASERMKLHRELLARRQEFTSLVFMEARAKLADYVSTSDYREKMLARIDSLAKVYDHTVSTVYLFGGDAELAPEVKKRLPGCMVEIAGDIVIGGFRLLNRGASVLIDETLDRKLEDQRDWFLQNCGMQVI